MTTVIRHEPPVAHMSQRLHSLLLLSLQLTGSEATEAALELNAAFASRSNGIKAVERLGFKG